MARMVGVDAALIWMNDEMTSKDRKKCVETLITIFRNVKDNPDQEVYRKLRIKNKILANDVWRFRSGQNFMLSSGWNADSENIYLDPNVDVNEILNVLVAHRDVRPDPREWVSSTKIIIKNPAKAQEENLRRKAAMERDKELAQCRKDMAERKALAERTRAEHRMDMNKRRTNIPSIATPKGKGGSVKFSQLKGDG